MAQLFDIRKVTVGPRNLEATVEIAPSAPLMTSEDPEGTALVLELMPELADHYCLGDASSRFGEVVGSTELAHLLEHVAVELLARTDAAGDISSGQTVELSERTYRISLACPDDVLVAGALSSAVWILQWAYAGGGEPRPDVAAIAEGLVALVASLDRDAEPAQEPEGDVAPDHGDAPATEPARDLVTEDVASASPVAQADPSILAQVADEPAADQEPPAPRGGDAWDLDGVPRPHLVR